MAELKEKGYQGGSTRVYDFVVCDLKKLPQDELRSKLDKNTGKRVGGADVAELSPRKAAWLLICEAEKLKDQEQELLEKLLRIHSEIEPLYQLVQNFFGKC